jgi:hypothetical protein
MDYILLLRARMLRASLHSRCLEMFLCVTLLLNIVRSILKLLFFQLILRVCGILWFHGSCAEFCYGVVRLCCVRGM